MRFGVGVRGCVGILAAHLLAACGQSTRDGGGGGGGATSACPPSAREAERTDELPARLEGTLCSESDALALSIPRDAEPSRGIVQMHVREGAGSYSVAVLASVNGELVPVPTSAESSTFALRAPAPDGHFIPYFLDFDDDRLVLSLSGTPGKVALDVDRPLLAPYLACTGQYEYLPVKTAPLTLPAHFELELCSARDSRVWSVLADAGRPVRVTLENPESADWFSIGACRDGSAVYEPLVVAGGEAETTLGLAARSEWSFTPPETGVIAFYASSGISRGERSRLRIEQLAD